MAIIASSITRFLSDIPARVSPADVLNLVLSGKITSRFLGFLKEITSFSDEVISGWLNITPKTFRKYKADEHQVALSKDIQEKFVMLASLFKHGQEVFGSSEAFNTWLNSDNFSIGGKKPVDLLNTISGIKLVDDRLTGIEYGDNA